MAGEPHRAKDVLDCLPGGVAQKARKGPVPSWVEPMLATLVHESFSRDGWIFEPKLDGERCLTFRDGKKLQLFSRYRKPLNGTYPELVGPLASQPPENYVADGEIVAFKDGLPSFSQLQRRMQVRDPQEALRSGVQVFYYVFDLLHLNGYDLREVPLIHRKELLRRAFEFAGPIRYTEHREREGDAYYAEACRQGREGIIAKDGASRYVSSRSKDWLKFKCALEQEFVIGGYTDPKGQRAGFGALLVGYYEDDKLVYAGKVGTGFDTQTLLNLASELSSLEVRNSPFSGEAPARRGVHWVRPKLVAQIAFTEWTHGARLRQPRFLGIRRDKPAREVGREKAT